MNENFVLLALGDVIGITKLSKSTIYRKMNNGEFPKHLNLGGRCRRWLLKDVQDYIYSLR